MDKESFQLFINYESFLIITWNADASKMKRVFWRQDWPEPTAEVSRWKVMKGINEWWVNRQEKLPATPQSLVAQEGSLNLFLSFSHIERLGAQVFEGDLWVQILAQPLSCCETIQKWLNLSGLIFSSVEKK